MLQALLEIILRVKLMLKFSCYLNYLQQVNKVH